MSLTPESVVREWFDRVWNNLDESAIDRLMSPDGIVHGLGPAPLRGPAQFKPFYQTLKSALGGIRVDIERVVVQGDTCAVLCHVVARHVGDSLGAPATDRPVDFYGMTMARVQNGKLVEGWNSFDFLTMYQQIGMIQLPQPA